MIVGIGTDLTDIRRIEEGIARFGDRFVHRLFTPSEQAHANAKQGQGRVARYAKYFAAKEATIKALGGSNGQGFAWQDFEVGYGEGGAPTLSLHGTAARCLTARLAKGQSASVHLSLTDEYPYAQAFVVISAQRGLM